LKLRSKDIQKRSHKQLDSKQNVEQNTSKGAAAAMADESVPNLKGKESERERRETTPRAEGQRAAVFSFSPSPEIPHYRDKNPPRWMTNLIFMNIKSHLC
jgi:hypothetical protein